VAVLKTEVYTQNVDTGIVEKKIPPGNIFQQIKKSNNPGEKKPPLKR